MKPQYTVVFYGLTFAGLIGTGAMMIAWHLTPPNPDRLGYWYVICFLAWPFLGLMGLLALALRPSVPVRLGVILLAYTITAFSLMILPFVPPFTALFGLLIRSFPGGFEGFQLLLLALALVAVLISLLPARKWLQPR